MHFSIPHQHLWQGNDFSYDNNLVTLHSLHVTIKQIIPIIRYLIQESVLFAFGEAGVKGDVLVSWINIYLTLVIAKFKFHKNTIQYSLNCEFETYGEIAFSLLGKSQNCIIRN